jgi:endonuclease YncB( thermonuclease family)
LRLYDFAGDFLNEDWFMKILFFTIVAAALMCADARAASLFGKVIEVNSGDVIAIFNLNRPVRVRLLGVDAPEMEQAFGDVAKKHLTDLVYDKSVLVEYAGIAADKSLIGRVTLDGADIGAQMIRDGAAWVDPSNRHRLSDVDRQVYQQSEEAARGERRGLWQQENPVAPWEFVKAVALRQKPVATLNQVAAEKKVGPNRPASELTSMTLIASRLAATPAAKTTVAYSDPNLLAPVDGGNWRLLRPVHEHFSALVPEAGEQKTLPVPDGGRTVNGYIYRGRDSRSAFVVWWLTASTYGEADVDAIKVTLTNFLKGFGATFNESNPGQPAFSCELQNESEVSMGGFTGLEFDLSACTLPARARAFTRTVDGNRQMYLAIAFHMEPDDNVARFINSFTITTPPKSRSSKK